MEMVRVDLVCVDCSVSWTWRAYNMTRKPRRCPPCRAVHERARRRHHQRVHRLKGRYGLSVEDYDVLVADQAGACAICGEEPELLMVDHCHRSGAVRGLLCRRCNTLLGYLEGGGFDLIESAQLYLSC